MENKTKLDPILVLGITIFFIAGCVYAYNVFKSPHQATAPDLAVTSTSSAIVATSSVITTSGQVAATPPRKNNPVVSVSSNSATSAQSSNTLPCEAANLDGSASLLSTANGSVYGTININNRQSFGCQLPSSFIVSLFSNTVPLSVIQNTAASRNAVTISGKQTTVVNFTWSNWCSRQPVDPIQIKFTLPQNKGYLVLPAINSAGAPQTLVPSCVASTNSSTLLVQ